MRIERALKMRDAGKSHYAEIFRSAKHFGLSHAEMLTRRRLTLDLLNKHDAPHWVKAYLEGYWQCLQDQAYLADLVYGAMIDGRFYSTHSNRPDYYEKYGIEPSAFAKDNNTKGHYWADSLKPFFISVD